MSPQLFFRESQVPLFPEVRKDFIAEVDKQVDEANVIFLLGKVVSEFSKSRQIIIKDLFLFLHKCVHGIALAVVVFYACLLRCALYTLDTVVVIFVSPASRVTLNSEENLMTRSLHGYIVSSFFSRHQ